MNQSYAVHAGLEPMTVWVNSAIFYDLEGDNHPWVKAKLFGVTCYKGRVPTFEILTDDGYVFSDVPPHFVRWQERVDNELPLADLVYNNCLSETFSLTHFETLAERKGYAYFREAQQYIEAQYWFSLDFYRCNNWFHCVKLANGQIAFVPSHKLVFPKDGKLPKGHAFPAYRKLRHEFKV